MTPFLASAAGLATQIIQVRVLSNLLWHHFAVSIVCLSILGIAMGATWVYLREGRRSECHSDMHLEWGLLALLLLALWLIETQVTFSPIRAVKEGDLGEASEIGLLWVVLMGGNACIGAILGKTFLLAGERVHWAYAADLAGGGIGGVAGWVLTSHAGGLKGMLVVAAICCASSVLHEWGAGRRRSGGGLGWVGLLLCALAWANNADLKFPPSKKLHRSEEFIDHTVWNPAARLDVLRPVEAVFPGAGGVVDPQADDVVEFRLVTQDGAAPTAIVENSGDRQVWSKETWGRYLQAAPFQLFEEPDVLVVGPGGGLDVGIALHHHAQVDAVEVNRAMKSLLAGRYLEYSGHLIQDGDVNYRVAEGRKWLETTGKSYDAILMAGVDTFAAVPGGTGTLAENFLYTVEGLGTALDRLETGGVLAISRWNLSPPRESLRVVTTLCEVLDGRGLTREDIQACFVILEGPRNLGDAPWASILTKSSPFSIREVDRLKRWAERNGHKVLYDGMTRGTGPWHAFIGSGKGHRGKLIDAYLFDVTPATDDRPYFFFSETKFPPWELLLWPRGIVKFGELRETGRDAGIPMGLAIYTWFALLSLLGAILLVAVIAMSGRSGLPLRSGWSGAYFVLTGMGAMFGESMMFQMGTRVAGIPSTAVLSVLLMMCLGGALGSWCVRIRGRGIIILGLAAAVLLGALAANGGWEEILPGAPTWIVIVVGTLFGVWMGALFPAGLRRLGAMGTRAAAMALALSSLGVVLGGAVAPVLALYQGIELALWTGIALILLSGVVLLLCDVSGAPRVDHSAR